MNKTLMTDVYRDRLMNYSETEKIYIFEDILPEFARLIGTNLIWRFSFKLIDLVFELVN